MHTIRLRHPWQCQLDGDVAVWTRKFNWPAELEAGEIVQLVVESMTSETTLTLNNAALNNVVLTEESTGRFSITSLLAKSNRLAITTQAAPSGDTEQCPFEVQLEIVAG